jgi:UDP-3-O-[3-hydroxymyristoyl] glucosamine N-acyltransferase
MKIKPTSLKKIADILQAEYIGDENLILTGINEIHVVQPGDIVFTDHPKYYSKALKSAATAVIINQKVDCPKGKGLIISDNPFTDFNRLINLFNPYDLNSNPIGENVSVGKNTFIHPTAVIGNNVTIGDNVIIYPNVTIYNNTKIGNNVIIHANSVIGADGFYYKNRGNSFERLLSGGGVIIEDFVEIGALTTIDRGVTEMTRIGAHTKIDNHVQIGHDTNVGKHCLFAAHVAVAGCVKIGNNVTLWGQVGVASGLTIADNVVVLAQSGVGKNLEAGKTYFGSPAEEARTKMKEIASVKNLPKIIAGLSNKL